ncbi:MAG: DNA primase [Chloroflexota bacterium]
MTVTQEIKSRLDIVDIVSDYVQLRKSGRSYAGFCPFHSNTRTPAFYVFPETQTWRCFGACAEGGDIFSFVMKQEGLDFKDALKSLAAKAGVELEPPKPVDPKKKAAESKLSSLLTAAADYFHQLFLHAPQAEMARTYVDGRSLNDQAIAQFQIGFALDSWDACRSHFNSQGYDDKILLAAGLLTENEEKKSKYDRFRNRLMIPIRNVDGKVVGFGARTLEKDGIPKYLNSPQTKLFDKSNLLFGLDHAKRGIREARQAVIVEGYMDVIQAWQAGFNNVVAQMGTALTETQLTLLKRYTKRFVLALDADAAGVKATMRSLQVARETLDRDIEVKFDARGLVKHEGRLQADIRIMSMPEGKDPDDIIRHDPVLWTKLVSAAKPVVSYVIDVATQGLNFEDPKAKTAVAEQVIPLIKDNQNPVERDHYWQYLARALKTDERALRQIRLPQKRQQSYQVTPQRNQSRAPTPSPKLGRRPNRLTFSHRESNYLCQCIHYPAMIVEVNSKLESISQSPVDENDFETIEDQSILRQMYHLNRGGRFATPDELCDSLDTALQERVHQLLALKPTPESELDRLADKLLLSVLEWRLQKNKLFNQKIKVLFDEAKRQNDQESAKLYEQQIAKSHLESLSLNKAKSAMSATSRRRAEEAANGRL